MPRKRFDHIDLLRAIAIIGVIATHVFALHLSDKVSGYIWNYLHFAVGMFVFSSGYVLAEHYGNKFTARTDILRWYKKRLTRLLIPLYIYLTCHYALTFLFPDFFSGFLLKKSISFLFNSVILTGGFDPNWLPLLFIQLTILFPVFIRMKKRELIMYLTIATFVTGMFTIDRSAHTYSRMVMWMPWSLIFLYGMYVQKKENNSQQLVKFENLYFNGLLIGAIAFVALTVAMMTQSRTLIFTSHKYPPDFYYLSYTFAISSFMLVVSSLSLFQRTFFQKGIHFISTISYSLFFIHYIVIDFMLTALKNISIFSNVWVQLIFVVSTSLLIGGFILKYNARKRV